MRVASFQPPYPATPDGVLVVVHPNSAEGALVPPTLCPSLLEAIGRWQEMEPLLHTIHDELMRGNWRGESVTLSPSTTLAPLTRTWGFLDGSAYLEHVRRARQARGASPPDDLETIPLMYQGASDHFLAPAAEVRCLDQTLGLDFEGELFVVTGDVPQGVTAEAALGTILFLGILNDFTLRTLVPREVGTGFGFIQSKPPSSLGPFLVTPDEFGAAWKDGRLSGFLEIRRGDTVFGRLDTREMHFSFGDLIAHAARTRPLRAGTIIGSGTVANAELIRGHGCITEKRAVEQIAAGEANTPFLSIGERVEIKLLAEGHEPCGKISNSVSG